MQLQRAPMWQQQWLGLLTALHTAGFDVWLGNNRGSAYSRGHLRLSPASQEFWSFSFDQMGEVCADWPLAACAHALAAAR